MVMIHDMFCEILFMFSYCRFGNVFFESCFERLTCLAYIEFLTIHTDDFINFQVFIFVASSNRDMNSFKLLGIL